MRWSVKDDASVQSIRSVRSIQSVKPETNPDSDRRTEQTKQTEQTEETAPLRGRQLLLGDLGQFAESRRILNGHI